MARVSSKRINASEEDSSAITVETTGSISSPPEVGKFYKFFRIVDSFLSQFQT